MVGVTEPKTMTFSEIQDKLKLTCPSSTSDPFTKTK